MPRWPSNPTTCCAGWRRRPAGSRERCRSRNETCRPAARSAAPSSATPRRCRPSPASSDEPCPTRRIGASSGSPRTGWPRHAPGPKAAYDGPAAFLGDLDVLQRSLDAGGAPRLAWGELQHLRWQVETFGFHLASMEVRQHSSVLAAARAELASLAVDPAFGGDPRGDRHVPGDRRHPVATGRGGVRARGRELHPFGGRSRRRVVARPHRRSGSASRCHTGAVARVPRRSSPPPRRSLTTGCRCPRGAASRSDAAARWR